jgi:hypothetical protein
VVGVPRSRHLANNTLNEALRIHTGPAWRVLQVRIFSEFFPPLFLSSLPLLRFL